ncbi:unnamed protein product [Arabidopsis halleri]
MKKTVLFLVESINALLPTCSLLTDIAMGFWNFHYRKAKYSCLFIISLLHYRKFSQHHSSHKHTT